MTPGRRDVLRVLGLAGTIPVALAGCGTVGGAYDWMFPRGNPNERPTPLAGIRSRVNLRSLWQAQVGNSGRYVFSPAVDGNQVYAVGTDGMLAAFDAASGRPVWRQQALRPAAGGVGAGNGLVAVGGQDGDLQVYGQGGKLAWQTRLSSEVLAAPQMEAGLVIVRTGDSRIWGLEAESGRQRWVYQRAAAPTLSVRTHVGFTLAQGAVFAGFSNGRLIGLDASSGAVGLDVAVALPRGSTELERVVEITSPPAFDSGQICAVAFQGRAACFDAKRGSVIWSREISSISGLDIDSRAAYVVEDSGVVHALDRNSGASLWRQAALQRRSVSTPRIIGRSIVVGDFEGFVHLLDPEDGSFIARLPTDGSAISVAAVPVERGFVVQTRKGGVIAMSVAD
jgi:outer membrane protein assembly factor BamB